MVNKILVIKIWLNLLRRGVHGALVSNSAIAPWIHGALVAKYCYYDGESTGSLGQPGLSWRASTLRQMALAGVPARYNKSFSLIRQYGPTFATAHGGIQCDCGGGFPTLPDIFLFRLNYN